MCKRIISLFLVIATVCGVLVVPVSATEALPPAGSDSGGSSGSVGLGLDIVDFVDWSLEEATYNLKLIGSIFIDELCPEREGSNFSHSFIVDTVLVDGVLGDYYVCQYCGRNSGYTADAHGFNSAYNQYVSSLQTDLGTTILIDGGVRIYLSYEGLNKVTDSKFTINAYSFDEYGLYLNFYSTSTAKYAYFDSIPVKAPFSGYVTSGYYAMLPDGVQCGSIKSGEGYVNKDVVAGADCYANGYNTTLVTIGLPSGSSATKVHNDCYVSFWFDFYPLFSDIPTTQDITINSRPTSIVGDYGIIGDDGTIIKVDGNMIVDESTSTVFNPVTNVTNNYTDYAFDYSDRSYNLTLEDGSTLKVVYGDENVTIQEGDTIYNIYYLIPDDSGSGDDPGTGETPGGEDMSWWKEAWTNFTDKLFAVIGGGSGASGGAGSSELGNVDLDAADTPSDPADEDAKSLWQFIVLVVNGGKSVVTGTRELFSGVVSAIPDTMDGITGSFDSGGVAVGLFDGSDPDAADLPGTVSDESEVLDPWRYQ